MNEQEIESGRSGTEEEREDPTHSMAVTVPRTALSAAFNATMQCDVAS
jgi:hypothetical protein